MRVRSPRAEGSGRSAGVGRPLTLVLIGLLLLGAGVWAGRVTVGRPLPATAAQGPLYATARTMQVGRSITLATVVTPTSVPAGPNVLAGTITSVEPHTTVQQGQVLYTVDAVPVRAVAGTMPFYRDLAAGARGEDVRQLQEALLRLGYLGAPADGAFSETTAAALRRWQKDLGIEQTGTVRHGELIAIPTLPGPVDLDPAQISRGRLLAGGEMAISVPEGTPTFTMTVNREQLQMIPEGTELTVHAEGEAWPAQITNRADGPDGTTLTLTAPDGGPLCAQACERLVTDGVTSLLTDVVVVPSVTGPAVPVTAISTGADGRPHVTVHASTGDEQREVTVLGIQNGVAVVEGIEDGQVVLLPTAAATAPGAGESASDGGR